MNDKNTIHDLEIQARNTRYLVDRINRAAYGMTVDELIKTLGGGERHAEGLPDGQEPRGGGGAGAE